MEQQSKTLEELKTALRRIERDTEQDRTFLHNKLKVELEQSIRWAQYQQQKEWAIVSILKSAKVREHAAALANVHEQAEKNGLTAHRGSPETHPSISAPLDAINNLVPTIWRSNPLIRHAIADLLCTPAGKPLHTRVWTTATGRYQLRAYDRLFFQPSRATAPTITDLKAYSLVAGGTYRIRFPNEKCDSVIISTRDVTTGHFSVDIEKDAVIRQVIAGRWSTHTKEPVLLRKIEVDGNYYAEFTLQWLVGRLWIRFNTATPTIGGPYNLVLSDQDRILELDLAEYLRDRKSELFMDKGGRGIGQLGTETPRLTPAPDPRDTP